jgi:hypothetical protein
MGLLLVTNGASAGNRFSLQTLNDKARKAEFAAYVWKETPF